MKRRCSINLCHEIQGDFQEAVGHAELGRLLCYRGMQSEAEQELDAASKLFETEENIQCQSIVMVYRAIHALLMSRDLFMSKIINQKSGIEFAQRAIELAGEDAHTSYPSEIDFIRAYWLLGAAYRLDGQRHLADKHLMESLARDRAINMVYFEADILLDLARLRYDQEKHEEAKSLVDEALSITERSGYVLQGADVNLFLAQYALEQEQDKAKAKEYAEEAKKLATCDGPPYYYKVAYDEAERFLEQLAG